MYGKGLGMLYAMSVMSSNVGYLDDVSYSPSKTKTYSSSATKSQLNKRKKSKDKRKAGRR